MIAAGGTHFVVDTTWTPSVELTQEEFDALALCAKACEGEEIVHEIGIVPWDRFIPCRGELGWIAETRIRGPPGLFATDQAKPRNARRTRKWELRSKTL